MEHTFSVSGQLLLRIHDNFLQRELEFESEHCKIILRFKVPHHLYISQQPIESRYVEVFEATMAHDAIFESANGEGISILAKSGSNISALIPREAWLSWQDVIADHLNETPPENR